ncbi:HNH endonuclease [Enterococcus sp. HY326]|uniref:HNH endonuclease n=1 Tax=Enterococcus sp. HY326 TaxID=2971265 RepID=UPI00223F36FF|nr:HNH endonuclease [Enterococcus sp. HY326]
MLYKSTRWKRKRENILRRDKYECCNCKRYFKTKEAKTVHHIYFYEDYPALALVNWNLISLCNDCHNKMHNRLTDKPTQLGIEWQTKRKAEFEKLYPPLQTK